MEELGTHIVLEKNYHMSWHTTFKAGTLGFVISGDGLLQPNYCWVEFPNLPLIASRRQGAWIAPHHLRVAELLEIVSGGCTDTTPTTEEKEMEQKRLRREVAAARRANRRRACRR